MKTRSKHDGGRPLGPGGKAAERLRMFHEARGIGEVPAQHVFSDYSAAVLAAILAGEAAGAGQTNLPTWRFLGPDRITNGQTMGQSRVICSGRIGSVAIDPANTNHLLVASAAGGVWESSDRGATWAPRGDFMSTLTTGAVAFDPGNAQNNTNIAYAGTGEGDSYWFFGQGMLRSVDGGTNWAPLGGAAVQANGTAIPGVPFAGTGFYKIIVDPADSQHILAGVNGFSATNGGLYATTDGGANWTRLIATADCFDISMQPGGGQNAEVLAATDRGLYRSADGGRTWVVQALPVGAPARFARLAVSISPADPTVAYAFGAVSDTAVAPYLWRRSVVNNVSTWQAVATPTNADGTQAIGTKQASYDWYAAAAPDNAGQVYLGVFDIWRGDLAANGAWGWTNLTTKAAGDSIHPDHHAIAFDPNDAATIYCAGDGGLFRSPDRGVSWVSLNPGLGITEIVYMTQDNLNSQWLLAGTQDNGSIRSANGSAAFELVSDGDGGDCGVDQTRAAVADPITCYGTYTNMWLDRSVAGGAWNSFVQIDNTQNRPRGYQSLFYPPVGVSGSTVAIAGQSVFVSRDTGTTWTEVQLPAGEVATALYLPSTDLVYAATKTGRFFSITYSAATTSWPSPAVELTRPRQAFVSAIRTDVVGRIWVTMTQAGTAPGNGQVFRSDDNGQNWNNMTGALPAIPLSGIAFDPANADRVWVSGDVGVWYSANSGTTWSPYFQKLPYVIVEDIEFHPSARVLRVGTRSRGIWEAPADQGLDTCNVLTRSLSGIDAVAVGTAKSVSRIQRSNSTGAWTAWATAAGVTAGSAPVLARGGDGRLQVFVRGTDGALWRNVEAVLDGAWAGWQSLGGTLAGGPCIGMNYVMNGSFFEMYARGTDGSLQQAAETAPGVWSAWQSLGGTITSTPVTAWDYFSGSPRTIIFARMNDGTVGYIRQVPRASSYVAGSWQGSQWQSLGGSIVGSPAVAVTQGPSGPYSLVVFGRGTDNALWYNTQSAFGSDSWSGWASLGGTITGDPVVLAYQQPAIGMIGDPEINGWRNRVVVLARGPGNTLWDIFQSAPGSWANAVWENRGGPVTSDPAVVLNYTDRHLEVFARGPGNDLWYTVQAGDNSSWSPWATLGGGPFTGFP